MTRAAAIACAILIWLVLIHAAMIGVSKVWLEAEPSNGSAYTLTSSHECDGPLLIADDVADGPPASSIPPLKEQPPMKEHVWPSDMKEVPDE